MENIAAIKKNSSQLIYLSICIIRCIESGSYRVDLLNPRSRNKSKMTTFVNISISFGYENWKVISEDKFIHMTQQSRPCTCMNCFSPLGRRASKFHHAFELITATTVHGTLTLFDFNFSTTQSSSSMFILDIDR